jgi:hypothetical protein
MDIPPETSMRWALTRRLSSDNTEAICHIGQPITPAQNSRSEQLSFRPSKLTVASMRPSGASPTENPTKITLLPPALFGKNMRPQARQ